MQIETDSELLRAVVEGNKSAQQLFVEELFAEIKSNFETMFLPFKCMKAETKPTQDCRLAGKVDLIVDPITQFSVVEDLPSQVEMLFNELLGSLLTAFEPAVKGLLTVWKIPDNFILTPEILKSTLSNYSFTPTHLWCGSTMVNFFMSSKSWYKFYEPTTTLEQASEGRLGLLRDIVENPLELYTDLFRYDTLRTLDPDELVIVSSFQPKKVWVEWSDIKRQKDGSFTITATQYVGEVA